ncbi:MAG: AsmA-like C-terminal domain-containing protein [Deltaproteobacteria bacterium]|nr:AsmA-like C-terminal domain-containing protein [Deltaproteobacteria bacterium]
MKKLFKIIGLLGMALALFFVVVLFAFYRLVQVGELRRFLISEIERRTHLRVSVGEAELQMGKIVGISFTDLAVRTAESDRPVIAAQKTFIRVALLPLLERRMVFYQVRFYRPTVRLERDGEGEIAVSDLMVYFPLQAQGEDPFALDLREVKIEKGEVILADRQEALERPVIQLREVDLNLRRIRAGELAPSATGTAQKTAAPSEGDLAVEFELKAAIEGENNSARAWLQSKGKILLPRDRLDFRQAWWDADSRAEGLPVSLLSRYYGPFLSAKESRGILAPKLRWQGSIAGGGRIQGQIDFKGLELDAPHIFSGVVAPGEGRLDLGLEWTPKEVRFPQLELRSKEINLSAQVSLRSLGEEDSQLEVHLTTPFLPLVAARKYVPLKALSSPSLEYLAKAINQGEMRVTKAGVSGPISGIRRLLEPGSESNIWLDAELKGAGGHLPGDRYLPLKGISGRLLLEKGTLYYKNFKGMYGLSRLTEIEGIQNGIFSGRRSLELRVRGEVDLSQLREQLKLGLVPVQAAKAGDLFQEFSGRGRLGLLLRTDFTGSPLYEGQLSVDSTRIRMGDVSLTQVKGELSVSPKEIRAEGVTALLGGSPLLMKVVLSNYLSEKATFDLTADSSGVRAGDALRLLLSMGAPQDPGTVRGSLHYRGSLLSAGERSLSGSLELIGAQLPLGFFRQPLREARGKVSFDEKGFELHGLRAQLAGYGFDFSGRWRYAEKPQLTFSLNSPEMDIALLLPQEEKGGRDWYERLQARGRINIGKGRFEGFEFSDLSTDLTLDKRLWRLENFSARSLGGTVQGTGSFADGADGLAFSIEPRVQGVPLQGFLRWFDMGTREITGRINLAGRLESRGATGAERKRNLTGNFQLEIEDGLARRLQLLVRILNVMDLTRWFSFRLPDLTQKGIRFRSVTGDFKVKKGIYSTENLLVDSDDLSISGAGQYDGPNDAIDAVLALRPFPRLGSVVSYIPLIGPGIAGIKDSVMVASFRVQGPVDDATITPAPLSTLSEWFFSALKLPQKLITIPGTGKK